MDCNFTMEFSHFQSICEIHEVFMLIPFLPYFHSYRHLHFLAKYGSVLSSNPSGILFPETACCPTHAIICEMLMKEPFEPHRAMMRGLLEWWSSRLQTFPADSRITESSLRITASSVSSTVQPGWVASFPSLKLWMYSSHLA